MSKKRELTPSEIQPILRDVITANIKLAEEGKDPVSVCIEGMPGISKTSICGQTAKEFTTHYFHKEDIADKQPEDFLGFPYVAFEMLKDHKEVHWVPEKVVQNFAAIGYTPTGNTRMSYALPQWLVAAGDKPICLVMDDFNRA